MKPTDPNSEIERIVNEAIARWNIGKSGLSFRENILLAVEAARELGRAEKPLAVTVGQYKLLEAVGPELDRMLADSKTEGAREERETIMRTDKPWPLVSIVETLANSVQHYLLAHDCDHHGWESLREAGEASIAADEWTAANRACGD